MRIHRYLTLSALLPAAAVLATGAVVTPAHAQGDETEVIEEIVVVRAPIERRTVEPAGPGQPKTEVIELSRQVSFADLDLTRHKDVEQLRGRIQETAERACERLNQMFPVTRDGVQGTARCVKRAVADAEKQLETAIEATE
ncbi:UrcA family protein [Lentisalinibacter orientalis]|uniref:UrcA family protein n=1 Tax=Lentisalinibacter orientalis TaxID=2992241 RepID=UPI00386A469B